MKINYLPVTKALGIPPEHAYEGRSYMRAGSYGNNRFGIYIKIPGAATFVNLESGAVVDITENVIEVVASVNYEGTK